MKKVGEQMVSLENKKDVIEKRYSDLVYSIPNLLQDSVPIGDSENDNIVIRTYNDFIKSKIKNDHVNLANSLGLIDLERAAKISGARFYF